LRVTIPGLDDAVADAAWELVAGTFEEAERQLTRFDGDSPLSQLNRSVGRTARVPPMLARALGVSWRAFRVSNGRFDPRVVGALEAAGERAGVPLPASPSSLGPADRWLWLDGREGRALLSAPIDLGGIGKGLALRWAASRLTRAGIPDFLVSAGGDLVAAGVGPARHPWLVSVEDPGGSGRPLASIELPDGGGLATSSVAVRSWTAADGSRRHHLIDPATQRPSASRLVAVTVAAADPAWAEVWSKVGFLAGDRIGQVLAGRRAWWVAATGRMSPRLTTLGTVGLQLVDGS
jgi:thiamine biosynthesis lipoprotein